MMAAIHMTRHEALLYLQQFVLPTATISTDTRQVKVGDIFMAYAVGHSKALRDGRPYIARALEMGAACVLYQENDDCSQSHTWEVDLDDERCIAIENLAEHAGWIAAEWYGGPSQTLKLVGVTGTNGKTSVTQWLAQTLSKRAAVIGTLGVGFVDQLHEVGYTTPDAPRLQTELFQLKQQGADYVALEVSSHALDQGRVNGTYFDSAVFTNLSQDHLDYHGTMAIYGATKAKLFKEFNAKNIVINIEDSFGRSLFMNLVEQISKIIWLYALQPAAFNHLEGLKDRFKSVYLQEYCFIKNAYQCKVVIDGSVYPCSIPVLGEFNLANALAVIATLMTQGMSASEALRRIEHVSPVKGRMEIIKGVKADAPMMVVDYAHTPDALQKVLETLRPIASIRGGQIYCVFGCGGDRDQEKRPLMGHIARNGAEHVFITSDNPRSEDPLLIMQMIVAGIQHKTNSKDSDSPVELIADRAAAIMSAVRQANPQDIVLVAGKGHETTQEIKGKRFDFSDQAHLRLVSGGAA